MDNRFSHLRYFSISILLLITWAMLVLPVSGQDEEAETSDEQEIILDLGTITVEETASDFEEVSDRPSAFTTVLYPAELLERSMTLSEALETVPGISVRSFGGLGQLSTISIRSPGSENVLITLDGVPLNPTGGSVDLSDIPLGSLERIEIIRGGEGAYSGAGAVGGVIRLTSISGNENEITSERARFSFGSFDTMTGGYTYNSSDNIFHLEFTGSGGDFPFFNDNGTVFDQSDDFRDTRENNEFRSFESRAGWSWDTSCGQEFRLSTEYYSGDKGIPGITTFPSPHASQSDSRIFLQANYRDDSFCDGILNMSASWIRQDRDFSDPLGESTGVPLQISRTHIRYDFQSEWSGNGFNDEDILTIGFLIAKETIDGFEKEIPHRDTYALWARDEWYTSRDSAVTGGIRLDSIDGDIIFSPAAGIKYALNSNLDFRSNFGLDFRPPGYEELYRNEGFVTGNPDLLPERTLRFDVGLTYNTDDADFELVYFNNQTKNLIDYLLISGFRWKPFNIGRVRSSGFEISTNITILPDLNLRANYTRTIARNISSDPTYQGRLIVGQSVSDLFGEITWDIDPWQIFFNWNRTGSSPVTPGGTRFIEPHDSAGAGIQYDFLHGQSCSFEIKNIFDNQITDIRGFPLPGRSYYFTLIGEW